MTGTPLPLDSPQFTLFEEACQTKEKVRVRYLAEVPDDPALPQSMRNAGLESYVLGTADRIDEHMICLHQGMGDEVEKRAGPASWTLNSIPKSRVLEIVRIGVTDPKAAMDAIAATQVTHPKTA
jgi:hypothetical protein